MAVKALRGRGGKSAKIMIVSNHFEREVDLIELLMSLFPDCEIQTVFCGKEDVEESLPAWPKAHAVGHGVDHEGHFDPT